MPVVVPGRRGTVTVDRDEHPRADTSLEALGTLRAILGRRDPDATVTAGNEADLLAGELDIHEAAHAEEAAHTHSWTEYAGWAAAGIAALALLAWGGRRAINARSVRAGGAA